MKGYIYSLASKHEDNIYYIGSTIHPQLRATQHMGESGVFEWDNSIGIYRKPPVDKTGFILSIIDTIEFTSRKELLDLEIYWIHQFYQWGFKLKNDIKATRRHRFGIQFEMTHEKALQIRASTKKNKELASIYGVSDATIWSIRKNKSWMPKR